jgi:hypothetical protein
MGADAKLLIVEGVYPPRIDQSDESRLRATTPYQLHAPRASRGRPRPTGGHLKVSADPTETARAVVF